jgi:hypothetical protein
MTRAILAIALLATSAHAHQAPSGWPYGAWCCSDHDCSPVPEDAVQETRGGYVVTVRPGEHHMVPLGAAPVTGFVPHTDTQRLHRSQDALHHVCIVGGGVRCLYVPPGGS